MCEIQLLKKMPMASFPARDFHCSEVESKEGQDNEWMLLSQLGAACCTKDTDRDGDLKLKAIAFSAREDAGYPTGYPINSLPVTSRPMVMI